MAPEPTSLARRKEKEVSDRELTMRVAGRSFRARQTSVAAGDGVTSQNPLASLHKHYAPLGYMLPWEVLDYVELLAQYNPDYSQAVDNIRTLANSGHELFVDGKSRESKRIKTMLEEKARDIQEPHGGIDGLIDKLLKQAAVYGAMCGEWVVDEDITTIIDFVDVNPKDIRFFWEEEHWAPYQRVKSEQAREAEKRGQKTRNGNCIKLNEVTFRYYAFDAAPNSPYGTPPFIAALANIAIQRDMLHNMSQIVKKVGLLGIIDLMVKALPRVPGETTEAYESRAGSYLDEYVTVIENMVKDGGIVHFDDTEVKTYALAGNAAGATNIFKQNEELIFSGLKSMPSVQGRSYSTTETYAGVAYDIIIRNTVKYQRACKRMIENGYWLCVALAGENPEGLRITFNSNKTLQRMQDAQAEAVEIKNAAMLWLAGLLDQQGFAQRLGFSTPKKEIAEPPPELIGAAKTSDDKPEPDSDGGQSPRDSGSESN